MTFSSTTDTRVVSKNGRILGKIPTKMSHRPSTPRTRERRTRELSRFREHISSSRSSRSGRHSRRAAPENATRTAPRQVHQDHVDPYSSESESEDEEEEDVVGREAAIDWKAARMTKSSDVKYLVREFAKLGREEEAGGEEPPPRVVAEDETYFPTPKVTFLLDRPAKLTCGICLTTRLRVARRADAKNGAVPAILPCGHVACRGCLARHLESSPTCPFCRRDMTHSRCGHVVAPVPLAHDTIHTLPPTVPDGGVVGADCPPCRAASLARVDAVEWRHLGRRFRRARAEAERTRDPDAMRAMRDARSQFETFPSSGLLQNLIARDNMCVPALAASRVSVPGALALPRWLPALFVALLLASRLHLRYYLV
ncbi:hypothetical protein GGS23DRAFT_611061 [Durotheca rogersii]|uniref:uncharacterized protein n=1 Tax=Durotheca rogersii TaxID=419775 RepID=UPI00222057D3|nr:uncharacterized protein GGS23DRAFT_611061 [Durotheca rogersii]KAI5861914.1 hypothetical protein GGS23DRAFT_611061 [Durotheca rogersii]